MNVTLDTFRKYFWNIAVVVAVLITLLIGISFMLQIRGSGGIAFGRLPSTEVVGLPFSKDFTFEFGDVEEPNKAKVGLLTTEEGSIKKAEFLAKVLRISGKPRISRDINGKQFVEIRDKKGFLTYAMKNGGWSYRGSFTIDGGRAVRTKGASEELALKFLKRLNLDKAVSVVRIVPLDGRLESSVTSDEKSATHFSVELSPQFSGRSVFDVNFNTLVNLEVSKKGEIVKASYKPIKIDESNTGEYPIIKLDDVENKLKSGKGVMVFEDVRFITNLENVGSVKFADVRLEYIADEANSLVGPFWVLEGKTEGSATSQDITVLVNAIVDKYLKD